MFVEPNIIEDKNILESMMVALYLDPDPYAIKEVEDIICTADGLLSIKRMYRKYGLSDKMISEYARYRKVPIFFFPKEKNGINMLRTSVFGDKIDYTLFDIKKYYENFNNIDAHNCKLSSAYKLPKTKKWLQNMGTFENLVDWYGIKGIFVDENYEVYDIEKGNGEHLTDYCEKYSWYWSDVYYDNLKKLIDKYIDKYDIQL